MSLPANSKDHTPEEAIALFKEIEAKFPSKTLGDDKWYLVALSGLVGVEQELVGTLYTYLISKPEFASSESRKALIRRIREALVKNMSIQGVVKCIAALISITAVEKPEDQDFSFSREGWQAGPANIERGETWLNAIYEGNLTDTTDHFLAHKDFDWVSREITYGLYLSDHSILGPVDTELVVLAGVMIQNLELSTGWHLRGTRRIGVSAEDCEAVQQCVELIGAFAGISLHKLPRVGDVEHQVHQFKK
ncbi:hypothetical protein HYALB_00011006 [Hymenoscyphus albidus]|uniref:Carboxymuconolactone decarboxylase-like domain-containing protein n=1 Tax=Hymenoscyphus albidus TaxID=595503 RepID=A0A9N9Q633_9HELO|nr:hypothetical protein HYALB_00011006 [Hymenoscyphus albidus]